MCQNSAVLMSCKIKQTLKDLWGFKYWKENPVTSTQLKFDIFLNVLSMWHHLLMHKVQQLLVSC